MATEEEKRIFFANRNNINTIHMGGKFLKLANFPEEDRHKILNRLAEKDEIQMQGKGGILPGIKIDGKQVTRDNIKDFELKEKKAVKEEIKPVEEKKEVAEIVKKFTKKELEEKSFKELKEIGSGFGVTDRSKTNLIKEILKLQ